MERRAVPVGSKIYRWSTFQIVFLSKMPRATREVGLFVPQTVGVKAGSWTQTSQLEREIYLETFSCSRLKMETKTRVGRGCRMMYNCLRPNWTWENHASRLNQFTGLVSSPEGFSRRMAVWLAVINGPRDTDVLSLFHKSQGLHCSYRSVVLWVCSSLDVCVCWCASCLSLQNFFSAVAFPNTPFPCLLLNADVFSFFTSSFCPCQNTVWVNMSLTGHRVELKYIFTVCCIYWAGFLFPKDRRVFYIMSLKHTGTCSNIAKLIGWLNQTIPLPIREIYIWVQYNRGPLNSQKWILRVLWGYSC